MFFVVVLPLLLATSLALLVASLALVARPSKHDPRYPERKRRDWWPDG